MTKNEIIDAMFASCPFEMTDSVKNLIRIRANKDHSKERLQELLSWLEGHNTIDDYRFYFHVISGIHPFAIY